MPEEFLLTSLLRYIGQTVTIFTTSGGLSGGGFTGTLVGVTSDTVRLITDIGSPPACPIGSSCGPIGSYCGGKGYGDGKGYDGGKSGGYQKGFGGYGNPFYWLGSVTEIPITRIASFTHNAI